MKSVVGLDISALDTSFKGHAQRGIGRYVSQLKLQLERQTQNDETLSIVPFDHKNVSASGSSATRLISQASDYLPVGRTTFKQQFLFPWQLSSNLQLGDSKAPRFDLVHFPAHMDAPAWGMKRYALTVLDLIPLVCSDLYRANQPGLRFKFARYLELKAIQNAALIFAISECTAQDVNRILGVPRERIVVTPLGVDNSFFEAKAPQDRDQFLSTLKISPDRPIVLYVGGIDPRKNYPFLLRTFSELLNRSKQNKQPHPQLVMAGNISKDKEYPRLKALIEELGLSNDLVLTGYISDVDLLQLYGCSSVFFFPSLYEGFGLPVLEAMAASLPVVSSNTSAMPEVLEDAGLSIDPEVVSEAVDALHSVLTDQNMSNQLREKGKRQAQKFTWERTCKLTLDGYRQLLQISKGTEISIASNQ